MKNYKTIKTMSQFKECLEYIKGKDFISYDIETNSNVEKTATVIGIGVTGETNEGWYFPIKWYHLDSDSLKYMDFIEDEAHELELITTFHNTLKGKRLIMHNGVFDIACIWHSYEIDLTPDLFADTILMKHTVEEERPFGLKDLAKKWQRELGIPESEIANQEQLELKESIKANGGAVSRKKYELYKADLDIIAKYGCADVDLTMRLFDYLDDRIDAEGLTKFFFEEEVMPLYKKCTIPMKINGLYCDMSYFNNLKNEVECGIINLKDEIFNQIRDDIQPFVEELLDKNIRVSKSGKFAEEVLRHYNLPVPLNKTTGKPTFAKSALRSLEASYPEHEVVKWLVHDIQLPHQMRVEVQKKLFTQKHPDLPHVFNLQSKSHLVWLLFTCHKLKPLSYTKKTNTPQLTKETLPKYEDALPWIPKLIKFNKENKVLSTYILPIIEKNVDGWVYPSMLQFGTTSGRYSCGGENSPLNLQTLPRDDKRIKKGFIAPEGYDIVNADFSSLEPRIFAWVSNDPGLKAVYWENLDLYSQIAIDVFGLDQYSAKAGDPNFLKDVAPEKRQLAKVFTLAVPYGAGAGRIASLMNVDFMEAKQIINKYLDAYPQLKAYMATQLKSIKEKGFVTTKFGRVRHQPEAMNLYDTFGETILDKKAMAIRYGGFKGVNIYKGYLSLKKDLKAYKAMLASPRFEGQTDEIEFKMSDLKDKIKKLEGQYKENLDTETKMIYATGSEGVTIYYKFRGYVNNARNFPIQGTAAHLTNAAMIKLADTIKDIDATIVLQVHDEICMFAKKSDSTKAAELLQDAMEHNVISDQIDIPILAEPIITDNLAEAK